MTINLVSLVLLVLLSTLSLTNASHQRYELDEQLIRKLASKWGQKGGKSKSGKGKTGKKGKKGSGEKQGHKGKKGGREYYSNGWGQAPTASLDTFPAILIVPVTPRPTIPTNFFDAFSANPPLSNPGERHETPLPAAPVIPAPTTWSPASPTPRITRTFAPGWVPGQPSAWWPVAAPAAPVVAPIALTPIAAPADRPSALMPIASPTASQPITWQPVTWQPVTWQPVTWQPIVVPATNAPSTEKPSRAPVAPPVSPPVTSAPFEDTSRFQPVALSPVSSPVATQQPIGGFAPVALLDGSRPTTEAPVVVPTDMWQPATFSPAAPVTALTQLLNSLTIAPTTALEGFLHNLSAAAPATGAITVASATPTTTAPVVPETGAPFTAAPTTISPTTSMPTTSAPVTSAPFTSPPITAAPVTSAPATLAPVAQDSKSEGSIQIYEKEYISSSYTISLAGDFDLSAAEGILFEVMEEEMRPYFVESFGPALKDFELSVTFQYTAGRRPASAIVANVGVTLTMAHPNSNFVEKFSQEEIDRFVHGFFNGQSLYHFQQKIIDSGVAVNSIVTQEEASDSDAPPSDETESSSKGSMTAVIAAALSGGLVVVGLAAAVLCRQQRYGVQHELKDRAARKANGKESQKFLPHTEEPTSNSSIRIVSYESNSNADGNDVSTLGEPTERQIVMYHGPANGNQKYMLDAPKAGSLRRELKGASFKAVDGPDLVALAPATWDDGQFSMAESTVYTRSNPLTDLPRPEYKSNSRGQKFRPWEKGAGTHTKNSQEPRREPITERPPPTQITTTRPPPGKERSRLWKPFNKNELRKLANEEDSVSSMKPRASASRNKKKAPQQQRSEEKGVFLAPITQF